MPIGMVVTISVSLSPVKKGGKLKVHLAPGGGFALKIK